MAKKAFQPTSLNVPTIQLDPDNPRLPKKATRYTQSEIIAELLIHGEVEKIAKSISEMGYFPMENLICYKNESDKKTYVVEGNRRICACKLLLSPESAPTANYQKKYKALAKNLDLSSIKKVSVIIVPERIDAYPMMVSKHTKSLTKDWEPVMQAEFYLNVINQGYDIEGAAKLLNVTPGDIRSSLSLLNLYNAAQKLDLEDRLQKIVNDPYQFELSTFKRVITNKNVKDALQIVTKDDGSISISIKSTEFITGFKRIVSDIASGAKDSRDLNKSSDIEKYIDELKETGGIPKQLIKTKEEKLEDIIKSAVINPTEEYAKKKLVPRPNTPGIRRNGIVTSDVKCDYTNKVQDVFIELKKLNPKITPNACAMTLRMLLELATYEFLKQSGQYDILQQKLAATNGNPTKLPSAELKQMLGHIIKENLLNDTQLTKALNIFINDGSHKPLLLNLNQFTHNVHWKATEDKLFYIWDDLKEYFKIILKK